MHALRRTGCCVALAAVLLAIPSWTGTVGAKPARPVTTLATTVKTAGVETIAAERSARYLRVVVRRACVAHRKRACSTGRRHLASARSRVRHLRKMLDALTRRRRVAKESARAHRRKPSNGSPGAPVAPPPATPPLDGSMWVGLNAGGWGAGEAASISPVVKTVRNDSSPSEVAEFVKDGFHEIYLNSGNYNSGGVKTISPSGFASEVVQEVKERPGIAAFEVLNEAYGDWYWGGSSESQENATAYANILEAVHAAFVKEFGSKRPLILASDIDASGTSWNAEIVKAGALSYVDGIALHPYSWPKNLPEGSRAEVTAAYATDKMPVYITELGWDDEPYEGAPGVTETEQATNIYNFVNWARATGYVADVDIFQWHNYDHEKEAWGIETESGRDKLSYTALKEAAADQPLSLP